MLIFNLSTGKHISSTLYISQKLINNENICNFINLFCEFIIICKYSFVYYLYRLSVKGCRGSGGSLEPILADTAHDVMDRASPSQYLKVTDL